MPLLKFMAIFLAGVCRTGCTYEGYDDGLYFKNQCACVDYYHPQDFQTKKTATLLPKTSVAPVTPWADIFSAAR